MNKSQNQFKKGKPQTKPKVNCSVLMPLLPHINSNGYQNRYLVMLFLAHYSLNANVHYLSFS